MSDTVQVRHDAELRVTFYERGTKRVLDESTTTADLLDAHLTVKTIMYGGVSGMICWNDPATGRALKGVSYNYELINPERDILTDDELCTCTRVCCPQKGLSS